MASIAFIGLGLMGQPMAANLVKAGHDVSGFDINGANLQQAVQAGVKGAQSAGEAVRGADVVITMLPSGEDTLSVWGGGVLTSAAEGTLFIDSSTIDVASARAAHALAVDARMLSLDAPVWVASRGRKPAR